MNNNDVVIIIPAYNPDDKFITHLQNLHQNGFDQIIVVDDGSREDTKHYFRQAVEDYNCDLVQHNVNLGQGRAYKSAFNFYLGKYAKTTIGVIQCDCDGQHHVEDINRCVDLLRQNPEKFILGVRSFKDKSIPLRSRFGNNCTSLVFKLFCGLDIDDTQTGLKGIPGSFIPRLMETPGERFEYASSVLLETKKAGVEILQFPIKTIYINGNETSHFNPLIDSIRIYSLIIKYCLSSLSAFVVDIIAFTLFVYAFKGFFPEFYIVLATYSAKVISCTYTFFVNKKLVFESNKKGHGQVVKFVLLCILIATLSGWITSTIVLKTGLNEVAIKIVVDTLLFILSFQLQNRWVFK